MKWPQTDVRRRVKGAGDGLDGIIIDYLVGRWLISIKERGYPSKFAVELGYRYLYAKALSKNEKNPPSHLEGEQLTERFSVREHGLSYWVDFQSGYSQGLFLDQRLNRQRLRELCPGKTVLNTFAYTCSFGGAALAAGAQAVTFDLSRNYLEWGQENYRLNGLE